MAMNFKSMNFESMKNRAKTFVGVFAASWLVLAPVWADDTEIFYANSNSVEANPNLLFIIDTSGSMSNQVGNTGMDRLEHVQEAFTNILTNLTNVNVGLMRFSNPGGPILYPVADLDAEVEVESTNTITSRISSNDDDVQELDSGTMLMSQDYLDMPQVTEGFSYFTDRIRYNNGDVEERFGDGRMYRTSNDLDFRGSGSGRRQYKIGLRFYGSEVPPGATINRAYLSFTSNGVGNAQSLAVTITGEQDESIDNGFSSSNYELTKRMNRTNGKTAASVDWDITQAYSDGDEVVTPDIKGIVQEIIDHPNWGAPGENDDMVFFLTPGSGSGERSVFTRDSGSTEERPSLFIEYYTGNTPPTSQKAATGLRFTGLDIPRGVDITSAHVEFVASTSSSDNTELEIYAQNTGSPAAFTAADNDLTSGRAYVADPVVWSISDPVIAGDTISTPDISALLETVTGTTDWCGGDDLVLKITGTEGLRSVYSHNGDSSLAPRLVVNYDVSSIPNGTSCYQDSVSQQPGNSSDDAEQETNDSNFGVTSSDLDLQNNRNVGVRFANLNIPQGAQISNAYIEFTQSRDLNYDERGDIRLNIYVENSTDAEAYSDEDGKRVNDRAYVDSAQWDITDRWYRRSAYQSPNLKDIVQPLITSNSWQSGNALAFKMVHTGGGGNLRNAYSYDDNPSRSPRLVIEYESKGTGAEVWTVRDELVSIVAGLNHSGYTPVQDTMYEAAMYYSGKAVKWGKKRGGPDRGGPHSYTRVSHVDSMKDGTYTIQYPNGCTEDNLSSDACKGQTIEDGALGAPTYESPIIHECQQNHIFLLTDGYANSDHSTSLIKNDFLDIADGADCTYKDPNEPASSNSLVDSGTSDGGECVRALTAWMSQHDMSDSIDNTISDVGQTITTHTIGFDFSSSWLQDVAKVSGGYFQETSSSQALESFVTNTVELIQKTNNTFVAPVAAVNQFNRLNHLKNIYFAVFRPDEFPLWYGNVKKYGLGDNNVVLDASDNPAVDPATGFFNVDSRDLWDDGSQPLDFDGVDGNDGNNVQLGGAASQTLARAQRNIYFGEGNLTSADNALSAANMNGTLTKVMFGDTSMTDLEFRILIEWMRGMSLSDSNLDRYSFQDPLHSRPVAVTYTTDEVDPDVVIFVGTNGGSLRAIDAADGSELWSYFPDATLPIQLELAKNETTTAHPYGIDGHIVPWVNDHLADGIDPSDSEDFVKLFFGMRRGGSNYYGMTVTDPTSPSVDWIVEGGTTAGFSELGQSWGTPIVGRVRVGDGDPKDVLFISGGYDEGKDEEITRGEDSIGRAVYIVDAQTGEKIWSGSPAATVDSSAGYNQQFTDMKYSIPATLTVSDVNADGLDDLIVVGDTGGQVWRFDISNGKPFVEDVDNFGAGQFVKGGVIADLGVASGANVKENNRRFYHSPDVALIEVDGNRELAITIGSGYRAHPLNQDVHDRFFMLRQKAVFGAPSVYEKITADDLYDATDNRVDDGNVDAAGNPIGGGDPIIREEEEAKLSAASGWYIDLHDDSAAGEKVLSTPLTFRDRVVFVTYRPNTEQTQDCRSSAGQSRVYYVWLDNAAPIRDWQDGGDSSYCEGDNCNENDRAYDLETPSIIDEPVVICTEEGCDIFTGAEKPPIDSLNYNRIRKTYWRKE